MSWVCSYCSSNNEDGVSVCFVCGTERSAEEIRAAKIEKRKRLAEVKTAKRRKLFAKIESGTLSILYNLTNYMFISSAIAASAVVLIYIIQNAYNQTLTDIIKNFLVVTEHGKYNIEKHLLLNIKCTILSIPNNFHYLGSNIRGLYHIAFDNLRYYFIRNLVAIVQKIIYTVKITIDF